MTVLPRQAWDKDTCRGNSKKEDFFLQGWEPDDRKGPWRTGTVRKNLLYCELHNNCPNSHFSDCLFPDILNLHDVFDHISNLYFAGDELDDRDSYDEGHSDVYDLPSEPRAAQTH